MSRPNKHVERSAQTRARLVDAARELFATRGYAEVPVEDVVRSAGVTRGALYHQFPGGKVDLFAAVFDAVEEELMAGIAETLAEAGAADPVAGLRAGIDATLALALDPKAVRLTILDAPAVLGWEAWRAAGERYGLGLLRAGLTAAMDAGALARTPLDPLAQLLLASVEEAVIYVARADDQDAAHAEARAALHRLLDGLTRS
ncbi:MAG TPA: TetR family transcriptional regulator [Thermoleophilaceae bacterium]|jgi:AcrR family transcriptional regulator|nr:TetR family transcriptional regulator [Thermoleophilaceae bacterium]